MQHQVDVGDLLLTVNSINTTQLTNTALETLLVAGATQYQVAGQNNLNNEQVSITKNGFR